MGTDNCSDQIHPGELLDLMPFGLILLNKKDRSIEFANRTISTWLEIDQIDASAIEEFYRDVSFRIMETENSQNPTVDLNTSQGNRINLICWGIEAPDNEMDSAVYILQRGFLNTNVSPTSINSHRRTHPNLGQWIWKINNNEIIWNDETYRIFGVDRDDFEVNFQNYIDKIHPQDRSLVETHIEDTLSNESGELKEFRHRIVLSDGTVRFVSCSGNLSFSKMGDPLELSGFVKDITEENLLNQEMDRVRKSLQPVLDNGLRPLDQLLMLKDKSNCAETEGKLQSVTQELENFVSMATHILRGPISTIIAVSKMAEMKVFSTDEFLGMIHQTSNRLCKNLNDLILIGELNYHYPTRSTINLKIQLKQIIEEISEEYSTCQTQVNYQIDDETCVSTDSRLLSISLKCVLINAFKYGKNHNGDCRVNINHYKDKKDIIEISDRGCGILTKEESSIFRMFYRGHNNSDGSGLGLYIARKAIERLDGNIRLCEKYKDGTKMIISL